MHKLGSIILHHIPFYSVLLEAYFPAMLITAFISLLIPLRGVSMIAYVTFTEN